MLADPDIQIVSRCTPHPLHVPQGIAAAKAGKHLLIEKPVALDLQGFRELLAAVRAAKVKTVVSFVLRWNPLFETIRALLKDGTVGRLFTPGPITSTASAPGTRKTPATSKKRPEAAARWPPA